MKSKISLPKLSKKKNPHKIIKDKVSVFPESSWKDALINKIAFELDKNNIFIL